MELGNLEKVPDYVKGHVWRFLTSGLLCDIYYLVYWLAQSFWHLSYLNNSAKIGVTDKGVVLK